MQFVPPAPTKFLPELVYPDCRRAVRADLVHLQKLIARFQPFLGMLATVNLAETCDLVRSVDPPLSWRHGCLGSWFKFLVCRRDMVVIGLLRELREVGGRE